MAYITINFDRFSKDDWDYWATAWGDCIDSDDDIPCPEGQWDVFFREGELPEPDANQYWDFLVCKYWDLLVEQEEERYSMSFDPDEYNCWTHAPRPCPAY